MALTKDTSKMSIIKKNIKVYCYLLSMISIELFHIDENPSLNKDSIIVIEFTRIFLLRYSFYNKTFIINFFNVN